MALRPMERLIAALEKVKTPMTLGGFVVIVLYGIYGQILKLFGPNNFPPGSAPVIVQSIVGYLFWLAIVAVVLGIAGWLIARLLPAKDLATRRLIVGTAIVLAAILAIVGIFAMVLNHASDAYEVHIAVLDEQHARVDGTTLRTTAGELMQSSGGWVLRIPRSGHPPSVRVFAEKPEAFLSGSEVIPLGNATRAVAEVIVRRVETGISGFIIDRAAKAIPGLRVSVEGYIREGMLTGLDGGFALPAHAAEGQTVKVHVSDGTQETAFLARAGSTPVSLVWNR